MRALVYDTYGIPDVVLALHDDVTVQQPRKGEVRLRVMASSINRGDYYFITGFPRMFRPAYGWPRPRSPVPGRDVAGIVDAVGDGVSDVAVGDAVVGELEGGGYGEFAIAPAHRLVKKPDGVSFEDAACLPLAGGAALQCLQAGNVVEGSRVVVNGASGNVGTFAVSIAKLLGAHVTAVCSTRNVDQAAALGADVVVDYTKQSVLDVVEPASSDVFVDIAGNHPISACRALLRKDGTFVSSSSQLGRLLRVLFTFGRPKAKVVAAMPNADDLRQLLQWVDGGKLKPAVETVVTLEELPAALTTHGAGHSRAKTVVRVSDYD